MNSIVSVLILIFCIDRSSIKKDTYAVYIILIQTDFLRLILLFEIFQKGATFVIEKGRYHFDPVMESPFQTVCELLGP